MKFKTERIRKEYEDPKLSQKAKNIVLDLEQYTKQKYNYEPTITEIFRYQEEQDDYYKNDPKYKQAPWKSTHQEWRAFDLRTNDIVIHGMIDDMMNYVNTKYQYDPKRPDKKTCVYHDIGKSFHFHIQTM